MYGILTSIYHKSQPFMKGKYTSPMDGMPMSFQTMSQKAIQNWYGIEFRQPERRVVRGP